MLLRHLSRPRVLFLAFCGAIIGVTIARAVSGAATTEQRNRFAHSIRAVPLAAVDTNGSPNRTFVSRTTLRPEETAAPMRFEVALAMRNFAELEARLARSEIIPQTEMEARYLPLATSHDRVVQWLLSEGAEVTRTDANRLAIFGRASVADVARIFDTVFARVSSDGTDYTSALSAPSVPAPLAPAIRGIHGLQPHQRPRRRANASLQPQAGTGNSLPYYPAQIASAYNSSGLGFTGAGQTIAVYSLGFPQTSDLTSFWSTTGVAASAANIQRVNVAGGPSASTSTGSLQEATLDVEWASAMAPGAVIRIYAADENDPVGDDELIQEVLADLPSQPSLHQLTISYGLDENAADRDYIAIEAQYMATLVSAGVTVFAASGDNGALDNEESTVQTGFPASMPDVTAVGGTTLTLDASGNVATEIAWGNLANSGSSGSTGGGVSTVFNRPSWQNVAGAPADTMRLVPDVAVVGDPNTGGLLIYAGRSSSIGGTSLGTPIWAAWCALMNEARARIGRAPLGALNPRIYPLMGTPAFRDITSGGNSIFRAGPGYDLCTGIGAPNVAALIQATLSDTSAPMIEVQAENRFTTIGQGATFYVVATGSPAPVFRWQRLGAGTSAWSDLFDNDTYSGSATFALSISGATAAMNGDQFQCVITNASASITSVPSTLTVSLLGVSTLAGWPGWSGYADGQGETARFNYTGSVRTDSAGVIYVADASNHTIRKISPAGVVTTLAGAAGVAGSTDSVGASARFNGPAGVAIDNAGNVFVADSLNYTIRKITPAGIVSTLAGTAGVRGRTDGVGGGASFFDPQNLALDATGNIFVADGAGNIVRKVTPGGVVTTIAGAARSGTADGTGSAAQFNLLAGIAVDSTGNVYVGDYNNNAVRKITPAGVVTTLAGLPGTRNFGSADGTGTSARLNGPAGLAIDATGNIFVADSFNNAIRQITPAGVVTTLSGSPNVAENIDGPLPAARFYGPADVALDASGILYVADSSNCTIRRIVLAAASAPLITVAPVSQTALLGSTLALSVTAGGAGPFTYQWSKDGTALAGATNATYAVSNVTAAAAGSYTVAITNATGTLQSDPAIVTTAVADPGTLINLSVRTNSGTGAQTLTLGFVLNGSANKTLLIRGIGPGLAPFGLTGTLADPVLTLLGPNSSTTVAAINDNWNTAESATMAATGAFALPTGSKDAAIVAALAPGSYTAQVGGVGGTSGLALAEVYDIAPGAATQLVNLSARAQVDTGSGVLIAGFTISGNVPRTVLIRGIGPSLAPFGVAGFLADPRLDLYRGATLVQGNDDWGGSTALAAAFTQAGAFPLGNSASKDAVLLITLPPGSYSAQVSGVNNTTGIALVEIYEMPN